MLAAGTQFSSLRRQIWSQNVTPGQENRTSSQKWRNAHHRYWRIFSVRAASSQDGFGHIRSSALFKIASVRNFSLFWRNFKFHAVPVLDRYLVAELIPPLICGIAAITTLGLSTGAGPELSTLVEKIGVSWKSFLLSLTFLALRAPMYVGFALPVSSLLASIVAFGRLGADGEITALKACGLSAWRMVRPAIVVFTTVTALHLLLMEGVIPFTNRKAQELRVGATEVGLQNPNSHQLRLKTGFPRPLVYLNYQNGSLRHLLYAHRFHDELLLNVTLVEMQDADTECRSIVSHPTSQKSEQGLTLCKVVVAQSTAWDETRKAWMFRSGAEYCVRLIGSSAGETKDTAFSHKDTLSMKMRYSFLASPASLTLQSVRGFHTLYYAELTTAPLELAKLQSGRTFDDMTFAEVVRLQELLDASRNWSESRKIKVKLHQRVALPFACLVFGLVGSLISLSLSKDHHKVGLALMVAIVFIYYAVNVLGSLLGQLNVLSPLVGAWMPNFAGITAILVLLRMADSAA